LKNSKLYQLFSFACLLVAMLAAAPTLFAQDSIPSRSTIEYFNEARSLANQSQTEKALKAIENAAIVAEKDEDFKALIDSYHKFAMIYMKMGRRKDADFYWDRAKGKLTDLEYPYGKATHKFIGALGKFKDGNNYQGFLLLFHKGLVKFGCCTGLSRF